VEALSGVGTAERQMEQVLAKAAADSVEEVTRAT
jgi:hypothetical protein